AGTGHSHSAESVGDRMNVRSLKTVASIVFACWSVTAWGTPPADISAIAPVPEIVLEIDSKIKLLNQVLETPEKYEAAKEKDAWQGFGVLAVMGQSLAEHPQSSEAGFDGAALRD